jgi:hypothetical protein
MTPQGLMLAGFIFYYSRRNIKEVAEPGSDESGIDSSRAGVSADEKDLAAVGSGEKSVSCSLDWSVYKAISFI